MNDGANVFEDGGTFLGAEPRRGRELVELVGGSTIAERFEKDWLRL